MARRSLLDLLVGGTAIPAAELRRSLGVSPATLSRLAADAGNAIVRMGRGRATAYARTRLVGGLPARIPVFRVDVHGEVRRAAALVALAGGGTWVESVSGGGHLHAGLPPVIHDMAPSGYLGRRFSDAHLDLGLPSRLQDWSDDHRLIAVARRGEDCTGDLVVGEESLQRLLDHTRRAVEVVEYPRLAEAAALGMAGSSAGGEQPKLAAFVDERHVIAKFTPGDASPSDVRWRDLLVCEALALETLSGSDVVAPNAKIIDLAERRFLEVERFDRVGSRGRIGVVSLGPLDDDLSGGRDTWSKAAARLRSGKLLDEADCRRIRFLEAFAILIANGDRHFGNITFFADGLAARPSLRLAPVYDMLPMAFAPNAGVVPRVTRVTPTPRAELLDVWPEAARVASVFWDRVAHDPRISAAFRAAVKG